jgi:spore coat protein CotH
MKKLLFIILPFLFVILIIIPESKSQPSFPENGPLFNDEMVSRVDVFIDPDTLNWIYENVESYTEFHADFIFNNGTINDTLENVGFRLRGNTSRYSAKKSFKISFNTFEPGRKYYGLEKMNLNGEHNDPSVIRSKLGWDLLRSSNVPASRCNYVELYINNNFHGLYLNVEHVDEEFVDKRFNNKDGNLYKCLWPADLQYLGANPDDYKYTIGDRRAYDLKTNTSEDNYSDLAHFIDVLNNTPDDDFVCELEKVFNVYDYLKIIAVDVFTGNWDGYIYNKNNFYLYHNTETGKFEYINYDLDNTWGIDWIGRDWGTRDIYDWAQHGDEQRPLYNRIMENEQFRDQYSFYMNKLLSDLLEEDSYFEYISGIRDMIYPLIQEDPFYPLDYGYTSQDFLDSYDMELWGQVAYGIFPYTTTRKESALDQLESYSMLPVIKYISRSSIDGDGDFWVKAFVEDEDVNPAVEIVYNINQGDQLIEAMYDDGEHHDGEADDLLYGAKIVGLPLNSVLEFKISAENEDMLNSTLPCEAIIVERYPSNEAQLFINEFMASNQTTIADEFGEFDDWVEVYNGDSEEVWLGDKYLTDNLQNEDKWLMPDVTLEPGDFILFWADDDEEQGPNHTNFKLSQNGEEIGIFDAESTGFFPLDTLSYGLQQTDISFGRSSDGGQVWTLFTDPTPGYSNILGAINEGIYNELQIRIYPNPVTNGIVYFDQQLNVELYNSAGQFVLHKSNADFIDVRNLPKGLYLLKFENGSNVKLLVR